MAVVIFGFWNVPVVRTLINPLKLFTIGLHELCHITAVCGPLPNYLKSSYFLRLSLLGGGYCALRSIHI